MDLECENDRFSDLVVTSEAAPRTVQRFTSNPICDVTQAPYQLQAFDDERARFISELIYIVGVQKVRIAQKYSIIRIVSGKGARRYDILYGPKKLHGRRLVGLCSCFVDGNRAFIALV